MSLGQTAGRSIFDHYQSLPDHRMNHYNHRKLFCFKLFYTRTKFAYAAPDSTQFCAIASFLMLVLSQSE
ncbi:hypothetical protein CKX93_02170 [Ectothiorhodosinus mongolicus]|nr:hypothetical protein CKX93_02170 [Ectothiorhodosinus mongolicus]